MPMKALAITFCLILLTACQSSNEQESTYINPDYDVSNLTRYTWGDKVLSTVGVLSGGNFIELEQHLKQTVAPALAKKGYVLVSADADPEFRVNFVAGAADQMTTSVHNVNKGTLDFNSNFTWSQANEHLHGGLSLVFKDLNNDKILWQGTASQKIKNSRKNTKNIDQLLARIFATLPNSN
jgi:hypothetical protein